MKSQQNQETAFRQQTNSTIKNEQNKDHMCEAFTLNNNPSQMFNNLQNYCVQLKDYRHEVKPPITIEQTKYKFKQQFDTVIMKRTMNQISKFIKSHKDRKKSSGVHHFGFLKKNSLCQEINHNEQNLHIIEHKDTKNTQKQDKTQLHLYVQYLGKYSQLIDKIILYTWQLCNFRVILGTKHETDNKYSISQEVINYLHRFCISTSRIYVSKWGLRNVTVQSMQIAYFNLLKNKIFQVDPQKNGSLCCLIEAILGDTEGQPMKKILKQEFQDKKSQQCNKFGHHNQQNAQQLQFIKQNDHQRQQNKQKNEFPVRKKSTVQLQIEWFIYIIEYCIYHEEDFIKSTFIQLSNGNIHCLSRSAVTLLHFITLLLNKIINDKTSTEIVKNHPCPIQEIRKSYSQSNSLKSNDSASVSSQSALISLCISVADYQWLLTILLNQSYRCYKKELKGIWEVCHSQQSLILSNNYSKIYIESVMNIIAIINCANFLGGYNPHLQKKTTKLVYHFAFQFLQLSYLIYELSHAKKRNIEVKIAQSIKKDYIKNLQKILEIDRQNSNQLKYLQLEDYHKVFPLEEGQIVYIIRLLSNLVHINQDFQQLFQQNLKYFRIIMSLTHQCQSQLTMKNWAIVFLKNVSQSSSIMRGQLQKLNIDVKVDNGTIPQFI